MFTANGPRVLEFNVRVGDPETECILPLLQSDLAEILLACTQDRLAELPVVWRDGACATVVVAAPGYPATYPKGLPISGADAATNSRPDRLPRRHAPRGGRR
jgi:phosphoribosylamine-glycine ligase